MSERTDDLLDQLTIDEKAAMCAGVDMWHTAAVERLGIPALKVTDGPLGARGERWTGGRSHAFPCGTALGATWDPDLVRRVGERLGVEARRKKAHVLLAPTVNIHRHPLAGRNFECYSEDPYLSARIAVGYIEGVQSQGVGCSVKHLVANDSEFERMTISSEVDMRTLREISLVPFEAAVREAGAWSVMSAYNRLHGTYCSENAWLLTDLLKREWEFDGFVVSDWFGTHSTTPAANAGLDVEMPGPPQWFGGRLAQAVRDGEVDEKVLDDKVRRVLTILERSGGLDEPRIGPEESVDDPADRAVAREAASASFVLLRNENDALPVSSIKTLAVIGPNADVAHVMGGGSARVSPHPLVSPVQGLRARFSDTDVVFERGCTNHKRIPPLDTRFLAGPLQVEYFAGREREGRPVLVESGERAWFTWLGPVGGGVPADFSVRLRATLQPPESGTWTLSLVQAGRARLFFDGEVLLDNWNPAGRSDAFYGFGSEELTATVELVAGQTYDIEVEAVPAAPSMGGLGIGCLPPEGADMLPRALALAARADAVICVVGTDGEWESEGHDRESMALPGAQDDLVRAVAAVNPRTVVVVNAASPVSMPWAGAVAAVMQCWFPGEEWGNALADIVSGDVSPSAKLPTTLPKRLEDTPAFTNYPGERGQVRYGEGVFVGYRWYDTREIEPQFCFGHGLSYTTFEIGEPTWNGSEVTVRVTNTGKRPGAEVVQCYVRDVEASVARPLQELKAFAKVMLEPGEHRDVTFTLDDRAFAFWDVDRSDWTAEPGDFELR
ncbi:MAG: glycoside hydrolase family 3 C-terminal domain-containing protein, partial [Actinomycetota bacterium]|nr:glycoside hydrolase family 3 C-terminal domain-containing protein [Actinomycetota bacterium]